jgi:hypothetical protein
LAKGRLLANRLSYPSLTEARQFDKRVANAI